MIATQVFTRCHCSQCETLRRRYEAWVERYRREQALRQPLTETCDNAQNLGMIEVHASDYPNPDNVGSSLARVYGGYGRRAIWVLGGPPDWVRAARLSVTVHYPTVPIATVS